MTRRKDRLRPFTPCVLQGVTSGIVVLVIMRLIIFSACTTQNAQQHPTHSAVTKPVHGISPEKEGYQKEGFPSLQEKTKVVQWLQRNNLNQYGDPMGTMYPGSTPLYDEMTGHTTTRYQYLLKHHPKKPWQQDPSPPEGSNSPYNEEGAYIGG